MLRHSGRAAVEVGQAVHRFCAFALTLTVVLSVVVFGASWRLSKGPVDLGFLKDRVETAATNSIAPARMTIGGVSIAWRGFSHGLNQPLVLRVTDLTIREAEGSAGIHIPVAEAALSFRWLIVGRVLPRAITLEGARLVLTRDKDGTVSFNIGGGGNDTEPSPLNGLLGVLRAPTETDLQAGGGRFSQLSAVSIRAGTVLLNDRLMDMTLSADRADIDLSRPRGGGIEGHAKIMLALGEQKAVLEGRFNLPAAARTVHVVAGLSSVTPKALARAVPGLAPLATVDLPLTLDGEADLGLDLTVAHMRLRTRAGTGKVFTDGGSFPVRRAELVLAGTPEQATVESGVIELQPAHGAPITTLGTSGRLTYQGGRLAAALHLTLDQANFADLPVLWPPDIAPPARDWIVENVTSGRARDGRFDVSLEKSDDAPDIVLNAATGTLEADGLTVTWLTSVPRVEQAKAHLVLTDPDKIEIDIRSGRQRVNGGESIAVQNGRVTVSGLSKKDQVATVQCDAIGSLPSAIALLKEPRLRILDRHPMDLRAPAGDVRMNIRAVVPLLLNLKIDDVTLHGVGNVAKVHLTGIVAGRDVDDGNFAIDVDTNHLSIKGAGRIAGIQSNVDALMDFRAGPASQVVQRYVANGRASARQLNDAGLDTVDSVIGEVGLNVVVNQYRSGEGELLVDADLVQAELLVAPLAWRKPVGFATKASARIVLAKDKMTAVERLAVDGPGIQVRGGVSVVGGKLDTVRLDRAILGRSDVTGTIRLPRDGPIIVDLTGPALDISGKLLEKSAKKDPLAPDPAWSMRGRFDRVLLAHDQWVQQVAAAVDNDGAVFRGLVISGKAASGKPFSLRIGQAAMANGRTVRRLAINVDDAGTILRGLDATKTILGGTLTVSGDFDDTTRDHTLSGTLEISDFRVAQAPALGKLLQAVTLYGLVDALGGPGLSFAQLTAPFQLNSEVLVLRDARAFSPSLGLTARGRIDRTGDRIALEGTLVPAYVFNSLLGRIPLLGRLFSAEEGGGLFAMNYSLRGQADNPTVTVNPLSAVTPGILRGMFGMFDQEPTARLPPLDRETAGGNAQRP